MLAARLGIVLDLAVGLLQLSSFLEGFWEENEESRGGTRLAGKR